MNRLTKSLGIAAVLGALALPAMAQQGQGRPQGPRPLRGKVTAKADKSFDMQVMRRRGEAAEQCKVNLEDATKLYKIDKGVLADVAQGYFVSVVGPADGGKVTAQGVLQLIKPEAGSKEPLQGLGGIAFMAGRLFGAAQGQRPTVGVVTSTNPLKVKTREGEMEVTTNDDTKVMVLKDLAPADLAVDSIVTVIPTDEVKDNAVTAKTVIQVPQMERRQGQAAR